MSGDLHLLVCEQLVDDARAALASGDTEGLEVVLLPRPCDPRPKVRDALLEAVERRVQATGAAQVLVGGGCLAGHGPSPAETFERLAPDTCFALFVNQDVAEAEMAARAYLVTPGWLARWRRNLAALGLDRDALRALFQESAERIVLLDTRTLPNAEAALAELGDYLGLPATRVEVGLDHLRARLVAAGWAAKSRALSTAKTELSALRRRTADATAIADLAERVGATLDEEDITRELRAIALTLTSARQAVWVPIVRGHREEPRTSPGGELASEVLTEIERAAPGPTVVASGDGAMIRIDGADGPLGVFAILGVERREDLPRYLALLEPLVHAVRPMLGNARNIHGLIHLCAWCKRVVRPDGHLETIEAHIHRHSTASLTHGMCPECYDRLDAEVTAEADTADLA